jgi:hypothetical protein
MWTLAFGHHEDRTATHGYAATREAAMAAFAKSWRREWDMIRDRALKLMRRGGSYRPSKISRVAMAISDARSGNGRHSPRAGGGSFFKSVRADRSRRAKFHIKAIRHFKLRSPANRFEMWIVDLFSRKRSTPTPPSMPPRAVF